jgi:hypothetical protein
MTHVYAVLNSATPPKEWPVRGLDRDLVDDVGAFIHLLEITTHTGIRVALARWIKHLYNHAGLTNRRG